MKKLLIIGARGYGREVFNDIMIFHSGYIQVKGFLDDKSDALDGFEGYAPIISSVENYNIEDGDVFYCALGDNKAREKYIKIIKDKGGEFLSLVHPTAIIHPDAKIGKGASIGQYCTISSNVEIGDFSFIFSYTTLGHDVIVGENCTIEGYTFMGGYSQAADNATLHTRSTILPHKKVGEGSTVGAGSIVIRNVKPGTTVFGNPAREV
ncbi:NeuD/PglB/VioB family sugar acetyltransferase [Dysgonomonas sp. HGC4]|uniref:NeuD/PglB/VioB family sugar acetyltransferase n=1 Tax=Dysgonomonas sp. HGC4 TaxID=1658009 RepID=UPI00067FE6B1|nr:NeuD/PglB/VioB family sugar acetyltransferase [Dysgonomonas sp. HGC4]MBD8348144.1 NeuD/PglB/VioB family sugar acetyltransferase [Dysgonomonas sp. HGC4]